ncbi:MAG: protein translocase subunit SecF [Candidatus Uhrbacteria bacterium]|nr:protein translocase subunit SecF [Candidatus Uhrbacteria bacterium]
MKTFNIIGRSKLWLAISGAILTLAIASLFIFGLNFGIDFTGGSVLQISATNTSVDALRESMNASGFDAVVQSAGTDSYFLRLGPLSEEEHQAVLKVVHSVSPDAVESKFDSVGPVIGDELKSKSSKAVVIMLVMIALYIAWAFRKVSTPVSSWKYGVVTMIAAFHDVIIPLGVFSVLGHFFGYQVDTAFVAAVLTVLGYSINDTIVVLDRTRENLTRNRHSDRPFGETVNSSIVQTLGRSMNTTLTTLLPLLAIVIVGGETIRPFALALMIGIAAGAYSSIFVASPLLVLWEKKR